MDRAPRASVMSRHRQPNSPVRVWPDLSGSNTSPYLTAATPSIVLIWKGNKPMAHTVDAPSVKLWYALDTPSVIANMASEIPTTLRCSCLVSKMSPTPSHTSPTGRVCAQVVVLRPTWCSTTRSTMLSQLSTRRPRDRTPAAAIRNTGCQSGAHMTAFSRSEKASSGSSASVQRAWVRMGRAMTTCSSVFTKQCTLLYRLKSRNG